MRLIAGLWIDCRVNINEHRVKACLLPVFSLKTAYRVTGASDAASARGGSTISAASVDISCGAAACDLIERRKPSRRTNYNRTQRQRQG
jgi:hypothetical protein